MESSSTERRRHQKFVTRNTEYHLRDDVCVAVRDRRSGRWLQGHAAVRLRTLFPPNRATDWVGQKLKFLGRGTDVLTSAVQAVERPERDCVSHYAIRATAGEILLN